MTFELFDPQAGLSIRQGNLPHWYQQGVTYFVTFRTEDSVPQELMREWHGRRAEWLLQHGIDPSNPHWQASRETNPKVQRAYHATFTREFMEYLDRGSGACVLRNPALANIVANSLHHFDGDRYDLGDFVVMPNHVHLLVGLRGATDIEAQCFSWKKYSAGKINKALGQRGRFWQEESFDHLVRSPEQLEYLRGYIADNPTRAGLNPGEALLFRR